MEDYKQGLVMPAVSSKVFMLLQVQYEEHRPHCTEFIALQVHRIMLAT